MLKKLYIHQYRCLQNFEISLDSLNSALLLGKNGSGKSSLFDAVGILQQIGRGVTPINELIQAEDFTFGQQEQPILLEIEATLNARNYRYTLEIEFPAHFHSPKVKREILEVDGDKTLHREGGKTALLNPEREFTLDWHHVGLPLISNTKADSPIALFRAWLGNIVVLSPWPARFHGISKQESPYLDKQASQLMDWVRHLLAESPNLYTRMAGFLQQRMNDFELFRFESTGKNERELIFSFQAEGHPRLELGLGQLSDGEKIYFLTSAVLAAIGTARPILCLWDEPDHFVALREIGHFITACRKEFENNPNGSQLLVSTHNPRVINEFSSHNTFILSRSSHAQPARLARLQDREYLSTSAIDAFENGELD